VVISGTVDTAVGTSGGPVKVGSAWTSAFWEGTGVGGDDDRRAVVGRGGVGRKGAGEGGGRGEVDSSGGEGRWTIAGRPLENRPG